MENLTINGRYRILQQIGVGGFGLTYLAEDCHLPTRPRCVVKHLKPQIADEETMRLANRLFQQEAEILYRLGGHPNIPSLIAHFKENGEFYLVQEYIDGHTIDREFLGGRKYNQKELIQLLGQVLEILAFVHSQNVIHRDVKPANLIRRASDGNVFLIDFGAVKQVNSVPRGAPGSTFSTITIGSHGYMAMEQMAGNPNFSSDLYALGLVAIQALTGVKPLDLPKNPNTNEFVWTNRVQVSPEVEHFITKLVRYDFRQRFYSAQEALKSLNVIASRTGFFQNRAYPPPLQKAPPAMMTVDPMNSPRSAPLSEPAANPNPNPGITPAGIHNPIPPVVPVGSPPTNPVVNPNAGPLPPPLQNQPPMVEPPPNFPPPPNVPGEEILPTIIVPSDERTNYQHRHTQAQGYRVGPQNSSYVPAAEKSSSSKVAVIAAIFFMCLGGIAAAAKLYLKFTGLTEPTVAEKRASEKEDRKKEAERQRQISDLSGRANPSMLYEEAETQANEAELKEKSATTRFEWEEISKKYQRASNLLASIDETNPNYAKAQEKIELYKQKADSALSRSKVLVNGLPAGPEQPARSTDPSQPAPVSSSNPARPKLTMPGKQAAKSYLSYNMDNGYDISGEVVTSETRLFSSKVEKGTYEDKGSETVSIDYGSGTIRFKAPAYAGRLRPGSYRAAQEVSYQKNAIHAVSFGMMSCYQDADHSFSISDIVYDELYGNVSYFDATFVLSCGSRKLMGRVHYDAR